MSIRTEAAVAEDEVATLQAVGNRACAGQVVGPERCRRRTQEHPCAHMKESQPLGYREATPLALTGGLAEVRLKHGHVGHREARAVNAPDAMSVPAAILRDAADDSSGPLDECAKD